jgi:hypothetical protein
MTAVAISIVHAASEQPHRIKAIPARVAGAMATAAAPARCRRVTLHRHPEALEAARKRRDNFREVVKLAIKRGIISQRGAHLYFKGKYLGNGDFTFDESTGDYNLEAEIRMAVKDSIEAPAPTLPGTLEEALANGWQHVGARGKSANFERHTAKGFCQLVKAGISGVLDVPFEATIKHGKPKGRI